MTIVDFTHTHISEAAALALANYEEEHGYVLALPQIEAVPDLNPFADNGLGVAAFDGGQLVMKNCNSSFTCMDLDFAVWMLFAQWN